MRTKLLKATCTPEEKQALLAIAGQDCLKQAEALRFLVRQEAKHRGLWPAELSKQKRGEQLKDAA